MTKIYRASQKIASANKSCPFCSERIRVGQPVVFTADQSVINGKRVAHHVNCAYWEKEG